MLTRRVEILLDPAEIGALHRLAKKSKKSVGALIREAVKEKYLTPSSHERIAALKRLTSPQREVDFPRWKQLKTELSKGMRRRLAFD